ncbi:MAG: O-antigen ligase family protein [Candidatus Omnitrophica bacterium]|nr:O-antigen ligase family protein [Candidatus Omnitrophota bacterium]
MIDFILSLILIFAPIARGAVRIWAYGPIYILVLTAFTIFMYKKFTSGEITIKRTPLDAPIALFFLLSIFAICRSDYSYASIMEIFRLVVLGLIFYLVINFINTERQVRRILNIILLTGTGVALFGILQYLGVADKSWWDKPLFLSATYVNHNHFAGLMEFVIPLSIGMILSEKEIGKKSFYIYSLLILSIAFLLSMSRGGWFSLSIAMVFMTTMILRKNKARFIVSIFILFVITFAIFVANTDYIHSLFDRVSSYGELDFSGRVEIWKGTLGVIKHNWTLGTGPGTFIYNFPKYRPVGLNMLVNYAHNDYLHMVSEMGFFILLPITFIIGIIIKKGVKTHNIARTPYKTWISLSLTTAILSIAIHALGDFNFYIHANAIILVVFSALIFNISSKKEKAYPQFVLNLNPVSRGIFKYLTVFMGAIAILFISAALAAEIYSTASDRSFIMNDLDKAERSSLAAIKLSGLNYLYPYKLANIYSKKAQGEVDPERYINKSIESYKQAVRLNPLDAWSWVGLADSYYYLSRYSLINGKFIALADSSYRKAVNLDPLNWYYLKKHAGFLLNSGKTNPSSRIYKKALHAMSKSKERSLAAKRLVDAESYEEMADLAFADQDINRAMVYYEMADTLGINNENAKLGQVRSCLKLSMIKSAFLKYNELRPSAKNKFALFISLGEYYLNKGYIGTANRFLGKSLAIDPKNPEAYQLEYKMSKKSAGRDASLHDEIHKILDFNRIPISVDFISDSFSLDLGIKKDMCERGEFEIDIYLPAGVYELKIKAKGEDALNIWPHMEVKFNNKRVMDMHVSENWKEYTGIIIVDRAVNRLGIVFDNDYGDEETMEDRNLYIGGIQLRAL